MNQMKRNLKKFGHPPGSVAYTGANLSHMTKIELISFNARDFLVKPINSFNEADKDSTNFKWINVYGLQDTFLIENAGEQFGISNLILEDIVHIGQRPKVEIYEDYLFVTVRIPYFDDRNVAIKLEQVSFILKHDYLLAFFDGQDELFSPVKKRLEENTEIFWGRGIDYLLYCLLDVIIDQHFILLSEIEDKIDALEETLISRYDHKEPIQDIYKLRRELLMLKASVWPVADIIAEMTKADSLISPATKEYLKDVNDHVIHIMDFIIMYREIISGMVDTYLSNSSNRMNQIITTLTVFSAVFIPLTFLTGIYGMNFHNMPELDSSWGYPLFWVICLLVVVGMYKYFKNKKWF